MPPAHKSGLSIEQHSDTCRQTNSEHLSLLMCAVKQVETTYELRNYNKSVTKFLCEHGLLISNYNIL